MLTSAVEEKCPRYVTCSPYASLLNHLKTSTCNTYKAIEQANSSRAHLDVTGIGATACNHGFFIPTSVVDFQKGERSVPWLILSLQHLNA